jgi:hypothetical protein
VFELGREANAGPPSSNLVSLQCVQLTLSLGLLELRVLTYSILILIFREAKIHVPFAARVGSSPATPFLYKERIMIDDAPTVGTLRTLFGINTTFNTFIPANSSNSLSFDYQVKGVLKARLKSTKTGCLPVESLKLVAGLPWFAESATCAQHFYNFTGPIKRVSGGLELLIFSRTSHSSVLFFRNCHTGPGYNDSC